MYCKLKADMRIVQTGNIATSHNDKKAMPRQTDDCPFFQLSVQAWASNALEHSLAHIVKSENAESEIYDVGITRNSTGIFCKSRNQRLAVRFFMSRLLTDTLCGGNGAPA